MSTMLPSDEDEARAFITYQENEDKSKYFEKLLEGWSPFRYLEEDERIIETKLRDSFKKYLESKEWLMGVNKEPSIKKGRRADLSLVFESPHERDIVHLIEFKYGMNSVSAKRTLADQINDYWKEKVRHVYVVIIEDEKRYVRKDLLEELENEYSKFKYKINQKFGVKGIHIYVKQMKGGVRSIEKIL